jgi:hypothetical protein
LIQLTGHPDTGLRVNAIWALKNLLYHSDAETRNKVLSVLSFDQLYQYNPSKCRLQNSYPIVGSWRKVTSWFRSRRST